MIDKSTVEHVAKLARLELSEEEMPKVVEQMNKIVGYVEQLAEVDTDGVEPTAYVVSERDALREDAVVESLPVDTALSNGPSVKKGHFAIPKVIG